VRPRLLAAGLAVRADPAHRLRPRLPQPRPRRAGPTPVEERDAIQVAPTDRVRQDLDHLARHQGSLGPRLRTLHADPQGRLAKVAEEIESYWEPALAPYWARIRAALDADIFYRARMVAEHGAGHLLNDLHASVSWDGNALRMSGRKQPLTRTTAGTGLLLIPSAFTGPALRTRTMLPDPPQLVYPARGVGSLWPTRTTTRADALSAVLGRSRALLLTELETPASTTQLAHRTVLSPAGVSQCLTALRNAGLVSAHRAGRSVLYARTAAAEALLRASGAQEEDPGGVVWGRSPGYRPR